MVKELGGEVFFWRRGWIAKAEASLPHSKVRVWQAGPLESGRYVRRWRGRRFGGFRRFRWCGGGVFRWWLAAWRGPGRGHVYKVWGMVSADDRSVGSARRVWVCRAKAWRR